MVVTFFIADSMNNCIVAVPIALPRHSWAFVGKDVTSNGTRNDPPVLTITLHGHIFTTDEELMPPR